MRKGRGRSKISKTLTPEAEGEREGDENIDKESNNKGGFFACYLLTSINPRHKGQTYIGFTVNPRRRIRQHNGEIGSGACRTKKKRPWEMVVCIYGFPTNVSALQFEWAWQHPRESLAVRQAAASLKSLSGIANKIKLVYTMLTLPAWHSLNITMNYFSTKYTKHSAGCPTLPEHMKVQVCPMDELPCYTETNYENLYGNEDECDDDCPMDELPCDAERNQSLCRNKDIWDDEECVEASSVSEFVPEMSLDATDHNLGDYQDSIDKASNELYGRIEEYYKRQPTDSVTPGIACRISVINGSISPIATSSSAGQSAEDGDSYRLMEEISVELGWPTAKQLTTAIAADKVQLPSNSSIVSREVEVIDISTPSPLYRISSCGKKKRRRVFTHCPEIIDLTKSPIFVQL